MRSGRRLAVRVPRHLCRAPTCARAPGEMCALAHAACGVRKEQIYLHIKLRLHMDTPGQAETAIKRERNPKRHAASMPT